MEYEVIRSGRRTLALEIRAGKLLVRAPLWTPDAQIDRFVREHRRWIEARMEKADEARRAQKLTGEELRALKKKAARVIPARVAFFAPQIGVGYGRVTIRAQRTRWGSCGRNGNLNFNCLLMLAPPEVLDSVVVHELCHRREMNHSARFYAEVLRVFPEYRKHRQWLKENGEALMARLPD